MFIKRKERVKFRSHYVNWISMLIVERKDAFLNEVMDTYLLDSLSVNNNGRFFYLFFWRKELHLLT